MRGGRAVGWGVSPELNRWVGAHAGDYDIIHAHSVWVMSTVAAVRAARRAGRPVVVMPHEGLTRFDMSHAGRLWLKWAKRILRLWYLLKVDRFIVASDLERLDSTLPERKAVSIPHPAFDETAPEPPPRTMPHGAPFTVGFLGRLHPKKNLQRLVRALPLVPDVRLVIGGDGPDSEKSLIEDVISHHHLENRVEWRGFIAAPDKDSFLRSVDLLAMPSVFECFGLVAAEALSQGTPVLVSPTVGVAETVSQAQCGMVVPPRSDAIAVALARLMQNGLLTRYSENARPAALAHFSFAAHGKALLRLYRALARNGASDLTPQGPAHN
jgi:glycosyltransferase involved in cell wall biosynthesis